MNDFKPKFALKPPLFYESIKYLISNIFDRLFIWQTDL